MFVGTRVAEILDLTAGDTWRYVESAANPADNITQGKPLSALTTDTCWSHRPTFLLNSPDQWPATPELQTTAIHIEDLRKPNLCAFTSTPSVPLIPDATQFTTFSDLITATAHSLYGVA